MNACRCIFVVYFTILGFVTVEAMGVAQDQMQRAVINRCRPSATKAYSMCAALPTTIEGYSCRYIPRVNAKHVVNSPPPRARA